MSKWVMVKCTSIKEIMIEILDEESIEDAEDVASGEMHDYEDFNSYIVRSEHVDSHKRHADEVFEID